MILAGERHRETILLGAGTDIDRLLHPHRDVAAFSRHLANSVLPRTMTTSAAASKASSSVLGALVSCARVEIANSNEHATVANRAKGFFIVVIMSRRRPGRLHS